MSTGAGQLHHQIRTERGKALLLLRAEGPPGFETPQVGIRAQYRTLRQAEAGGNGEHLPTADPLTKAFS